MKVTYYGHACFGVDCGGRHLLFDPFIRGNPLASAVRAESVPADYLLISHGHEDHIGDAVEIAQRTGATVISNFEIVEWLARQGASNGHGMNHGGRWRFPFGHVKYINASHSSSLPDGSYGGNPGGFVIETNEGNFYYSGDTALMLDMKLIGESTSLRFAALPIGDNFTMGAEDAAKAAGFVRCEHVLGLHYDTFPPIKIDHTQAIETFKRAGKVLHLLKIGETREL